MWSPAGRRYFAREAGLEIAVQRITASSPGLVFLSLPWGAFSDPGSRGAIQRGPPFLLGRQFTVPSLPPFTARPRGEGPAIYSWTAVASRIAVYSPGISHEDQNWHLRLFQFYRSPAPKENC